MKYIFRSLVLVCMLAISACSSNTPTTSTAATTTSSIPSPNPDKSDPQQAQTFRTVAGRLRDRDSHMYFDVPLRGGQLALVIVKPAKSDETASFGLGTTVGFPSGTPDTLVMNDPPVELSNYARWESFLDQRTRAPITELEANGLLLYSGRKVGMPTWIVLEVPQEKSSFGIVVSGYRESPAVEFDVSYLGCPLDSNERRVEGKLTTADKAAIRCLLAASQNQQLVPDDFVTGFEGLIEERRIGAESSLPSDENDSSEELYGIATAIPDGERFPGSVHDVPLLGAFVEDGDEVRIRCDSASQKFIVRVWFERQLKWMDVQEFRFSSAPALISSGGWCSAPGNYDQTVRYKSLFAPDFSSMLLVEGVPGDETKSRLVRILPDPAGSFGEIVSSSSSNDFSGKIVQPRFPRWRDATTFSYLENDTLSGDGIWKTVELGLANEPDAFDIKQRSDGVPGSDNGFARQTGITNVYVGEVIQRYGNLWLPMGTVLSPGGDWADASGMVSAKSLSTELVKGTNECDVVCRNALQSLKIPCGERSLGKWLNENQRISVDEDSKEVRWITVRSGTVACSENMLPATNKRIVFHYLSRKNRRLYLVMEDDGTGTRELYSSPAEPGTRLTPKLERAVGLDEGYSKGTLEVSMVFRSFK